MKSESITPGMGAGYTAAANERQVNTLAPAQPRPQGSRVDTTTPPAQPVLQPYSADGRGAMAVHLRDTLRDPQGAASKSPSPTVSVHSPELVLVLPETLVDYKQEINAIEQRAMAYLQQQRPAREEMLRSWPSVMPYKAVVETCDAHALEALNESGYQELRTDELPQHDVQEAENAENEMSERVSDQIAAHFSQAGWFRDIDTRALKWDGGKPLTLLRNCDFSSVQADPDAGERHGEHGMVRFLWTPSRAVGEGEPERVKLALKQPKADGWALAVRENEAYAAIFDKVGPHPNLMTSLGQARFNTVSGELFKFVPGADGDRFLGALHQARLDGRISVSEFEQVLALMLQRGLSTIDHCRGASRCMGDRKPGNVIIDERSGEPVFYDLGLSHKTGEPSAGFTKRYASAGARDQDIVDHRSDVFSMVASLVDAESGGQRMYRHSEQGRIVVMANLEAADDQDEVATLRHPADARETPFWQLASRLLYKEVDGQRSTHPDDLMSIENALIEVGKLLAGQDEAHVLSIMRGLSYDAARADDATMAGSR